MNTKNLVAMGLALGTLSAAANPVIKENSVVLSQNGTNRVTIEYELENSPAIVTVDIKTNNVSIGGRYLQFMGDVNKLVQTGPHKVTWLPHKVWPGEDVQNVTAEVTAWSTNTPPDYMVVSLTGSEFAYYATEDQIPLGVQDEVYKTKKMVFRKIPAAGVKWRMGSPATPEAEHAANEVAHEVTLTEDFYLAIYPMTQAQYKTANWGHNPSGFQTGDGSDLRPVENLCYGQVRGSKNWPTDKHAVEDWTILGQMRAATKRDDFDIPLEAQWEFACRAGHETSLYSGEAFTQTNAEKLGRCSSNGGIPSGGWPASNVDTNSATAAVGTYQPNDWGLYDMLGNVQECCLDWYEEDASQYDPEQGPSSSTEGKRVVRGANFNNGYTIMRSAWRGKMDPATAAVNAGLRVCCPAIAFQ